MLVKDIIAWLEKQAEQKAPSLSEKEIVCLKRTLDFLREEHNSYHGKDFTNEIAVLEWLITHPVLVYSSELQQNQGEHKSADKIEYVRADAFIEKACEFIAENMRCNGYTLQTKANFIREFRNYMKGEMI